MSDPSPVALDLRGALAVAIGFALLGLLLPIGAAPPMGDAWSYAWSARQLVEEGRLRLTDFQAMTLVGQLWLSWPFTRWISVEPGFLNTLSFGFSVATACLFFLLLRALGTPRGLAWLGLAVLVANPVYLAQSMTYDTEIYFLFASLGGALAFLVALRSGRTAPLLLAGAAFALAILIRQHALAFPIAAGLAWHLRRREPGPPAHFGPAVLAALALAPLALAGFYLWLHSVHGIPKAYAAQQFEMQMRFTDPIGLLAYPLVGGIRCLHYLGLFLLPLLPGWLGEPCARRHRLAAYGASAALVAAVTSWAWSYGERMPYLPNLLSLEEIFGARSVAPTATPLSALTVFSGLLAAVLLGEAATRVLARPWRNAAPGVWPARVFLGAAALLLLGFSIATGIRFERYLLLPLPFLIPLLIPLPGSRRRALAAGWALLLPGLLFSFWFVDQRVGNASCEWHTAHAALELGHERFDVDGGYAFNGYYSYPRMTRTYRWDASVPERIRVGPWHPADHPRAQLLVRRRALADSRYELVERMRCPGRLRDFEALLYRRKY